MGARLNLPKLTRRIPVLDQEFARLASSGASSGHLEAFIVRNYLPVAYIFALRMNRSLRDTETLHDRVSDAALEVIDEMVAKVRTGRFESRGEARFSTYLWSAMKRQGINRLYIPLKVNRLDSRSRTVYRHLYAEGRTPSESRQLLMAMEGMGREEAETLIRAVINAAPEDHRPIGETLTFDVEDPAGPQLPSWYDGPETAFLRKTLQSRIESLLDELPEEDREILELYSIGGCSIREIGRKMGLRSPQYRFNQARDAFLEQLRQEGLEEMYRQVCEKEQEYGLA